LGVLGNNYGEKLMLLKKFMELGGKLEGEFDDIVIDGLRFGIYHRTSEKLREAAIESGIYNVFIHGHTHKRREDKIGQTLVLNPGAAHKKVKSASGFFEEGGIMIFDTQSKEYKYVPLP
jgi:predicted phosphodiesterase